MAIDHWLMGEWLDPYTHTPRPRPRLRVSCHNINMQNDLNLYT